MGMGKQKVAPAAACYALPCPVEAEGELGGKGAQLNGLCRCFGSGSGRLGVPDALVVPRSFYVACISSPGVSVYYGEAADEKTHPDGVTRALERARTAILDYELPDEVFREVRAFVAKHKRSGVACRSSASCEDALDASYAGQFETVLNCTTAEDCERGIKEVWASTLGEGVVQYAGGDAMALSKLVKGVTMAVVLQRQVASAASGVMRFRPRPFRPALPLYRFKPRFTVNPRNGCDVETVVEAVLGQGEGLVSGLVTPDSYWVDVLDAAKPRYLREQVSAKTVKVTTKACGGGVETVVVPEAEAGERVLSRGELKALVARGAGHGWPT